MEVRLTKKGYVVDNALLSLISTYNVEYGSKREASFPPSRKLGGVAFFPKEPAV